MRQSVATDKGSEYFHGRVEAHGGGVLVVGRQAVVYEVDEQLVVVEGRGYDVHAMERYALIGPGKVFQYKTRNFAVGMVVRRDVVGVLDRPRMCF